MQQRRLRPGDVLDDYCPRERRITDHAIVAMIDETIQQTRCVVCDAEHEYKQAKVPPQRKKKAAGLFNQVLDGLIAPARRPQIPDAQDPEPELIHEDDMEAEEMVEVAAAGDAPVPVPPVASAPDDHDVAPALSASTPVPENGQSDEEAVDGPLFRRQLIRAALPRPEGTPPPTRVIPEFTIRQPTGRNRHGGGGRRRGQQHGQGQNGPTRFGRSAHGQRSNGHGRPGGHGGHGHGGHGGHGGPQGNRSGGSRRGGKKR